MIRILLFTGIVTLLLGSCTSKTIDKEDSSRNDSIKKYLDLAGNDTIAFRLRDRYNDKALSFVDLSKNDTLTRFYLSSLSFNYMRTKNRGSLRKIGEIHYDKSSKARDTLNLARYYRYKAGYLRNTFVYDSSLYYYIKAEKFYKKTRDEKGLAIIYINKRFIQYKYDDYLGAKLTSRKAYNYFKKTNNIEGQYGTLISIGNCCNDLRDYRGALKSFGLALEILNKYNLESKGTCLNNIGNVYRVQKKFNEAIHYFRLALKEKDLIKKDPGLYGFLLNNLAYCKLEMKDYSGLPNMLYESIKLMKDEEGIKESIISYIYLSKYFSAQKDTLKARKFAVKSLLIAKQLNASYYYLIALSNAGSIDGKKASKYILEYHKMHDSLFFVENNSRNQYFSIQLDTDEIKKEKDKAINQKWIISSISGFIIVIIVLVLIITKQRSKQKELQLKQSQQKANEEIYDLMLAQKNKEEQVRTNEKNRIALELHDGVMNKLASTRLNLDVLNHKKDNETIEKCLSHIDEIYQIEQEIRNITHDLTQEAFKTSNSFVALINDFLTRQNATYPTHFILEIEDTINWRKISSSIKMNLFRIIQEACYNINKFAEAENAVVSLILDDTNICLSITDDGKGFDTETDTDGIGLKNIKQRIKNLNGKLVIQSIKDKSTSINIAIPIA